MSSTLFARGVNTQIGLKKRAEEVNRNIAELHDSFETVKDLPRDFRVLRTRMEAMETHTSALVDTNKTIALLREKLDSQNMIMSMLESKLAKYEGLDSILEDLRNSIVRSDARVNNYNSMLAKLNGRIISLENASRQSDIAVSPASSTGNMDVRSDIAPSPASSTGHASETDSASIMSPLTPGQPIALEITETEAVNE